MSAFVFLVILGFSWGKVPNLWISEDRCEKYGKNTVGSLIGDYEGDFDAFGGDCYFRSKKEKTWDDARLICQEFGGDLISVRNEIEHQHLLDKVIPLATGHFWVGLNDKNEEGFFRWSDGSRFIFNRDKLSGAKNTDSKDCVSISDRGKWKIRKCSRLKRFVCHILADEVKRTPHWFEHRNYNRDCSDYGWVLSLDLPKCTSIKKCGGGDEPKSLYVPAGWELTILEEDDGSKKEIFQGPISVKKYKHIGGKSEREGYMTQKGMSFVDYPALYRKKDYKEFLFYATQDCRDVRDCHHQYYRNEDSDNINSLVVPTGWMIQLFSKKNYGGKTRKIHGPIKIDQLSMFATIIAHNFRSYKLRPAGGMRMQVRWFDFDRAVTISEDQIGLDSYTIENPSSESLEWHTSVSYTETESTNWFSEKSVTDTLGWNVEVTVSAEASYGVASGSVSATAGAHGETSETSTDSEGGEVVFSKARTDQFSCIAAPMTRTTCTVLQTKGDYIVPYGGVLMYDFGNGNVQEEEWESKMRVKGAQKAFVAIEVEMRGCKGEVYRGRCYTAKRSVSPLNYDDSELECYELGKRMAEVQDLETNFYLQQLCEGDSFWSAGFAGENGRPVWEVSQSKYSRWDSPSEWEGQESDGSHAILVEGAEGKWFLEKKSQQIADCSVCESDVM